MAKKRHHFLPRAYLRQFCAADGKLHVYRKDDPSKEIRLSPDNVGFHKHYYSQPLPDGGCDNEKLEDMFSEYERLWPEIAQKFRDGENVNDRLDTIYAFIGMQRARVPAARDACEKLLAETVKAVTRQMDAAGELPPPKGLEHLMDHVDVAIDPHQSIHAMVDIIKGTGTLLGHIGIEVVRNDTNIPFLTSDNPVIWFDPSLSESEMRPYAVRLDGPIMLLFPVAPDLMIYGDWTKREQFDRHGLIYSKPRDVAVVELMNNHICRFAYESVFADRPGFSDLVAAHAAVSPVVRVEAIPAPNGQFLLSEYVWGQRTAKPKWQPRGQ